MILILGTLLFALFLSFLSFMAWRDLKPTKTSRDYLTWYREDRNLRRSIESEWRNGNWS
jgi:hypothetical protein